MEAIACGGENVVQELNHAAKPGGIRLACIDAGRHHLRMRSTSVIFIETLAAAADCDLQASE